MIAGFYLAFAAIGLAGVRLGRRAVAVAGECLAALSIRVPLQKHNCSQGLVIVDVSERRYIGARRPESKDTYQNRRD
jgi:hypothetical protein